MAKIYETFSAKNEYAAGACFQDNEKYHGADTQILVKLDQDRWLLKMEKATSIIPADHEILRSISGWFKRNWIECWAVADEGKDGYITSFYKHNPCLPVDSLVFEEGQFSGEATESDDEVATLLRTIPVGTSTRGSVGNKKVSMMSKAELQAYLDSME